MRQRSMILVTLGLVGLAVSLPDISLAVSASRQAASSPAPSRNRVIDGARSSVTVRVYKSGLFSAFAHDHTVRAPIRQGEVTLGAEPEVRLEFDSRQMTVLDPEVSAKDRDEIQRTMLGPEALDSAKYPEIGFRSTRVEAVSTGRWRVAGELTLHGQTKPIVVEVDQADSSYSGKARIKQTQFGITPIRIAGGTVKVKDEVVVEFRIFTTE